MRVLSVIVRCCNLARGARRLLFGMMGHLALYTELYGCCEHILQLLGAASAWGNLGGDSGAASLHRVGGIMQDQACIGSARQGMQCLTNHQQRQCRAGHMYPGGRIRREAVGLHSGSPVGRQIVVCDPGHGMALEASGPVVRCKLLICLLTPKCPIAPCLRCCSKNAHLYVSMCGVDHMVHLPPRYHHQHAAPSTQALAYSAHHRSCRMTHFAGFQVLLQLCL